MDDLELVTLFTGYGYQVRFVEYGGLPKSGEEAEAKILALNKSMAVSMEWAYQEIRLAGFFTNFFCPRRVVYSDLGLPNVTIEKYRLLHVAANLLQNPDGPASSCARQRCIRILQIVIS